MSVGRPERKESRLAAHFFYVQKVLALRAKCVYNIYILCVYYMLKIHMERGDGMKRRVNITLEDKVIERIDHYADEHYTTRSGAITMLIVDATKSVKVKKKNNKGR